MLFGRVKLEATLGRESMREELKEIKTLSARAEME